MIETINAIVPMAKWDFLDKVWRVPMSNIFEVLKFAVTYKLTISPTLAVQASEAVEHIAEMRRASESLSADLEIPGIAIDLLPYQKAGVAYLKKVRKGILGDQPGLGKTAQAIATIASENQFPVIVVCPNTLKINWEREVKKFFPKLGVSILNGGKSSEIPASDVIIVNYDILYNRNDDIIKHGFKALIVDESHAIKNGQRKNSCPECKFAVRSNSVNCPNCKAKGIKPVETWTVKRTQAVIRLTRLLGPRDFVLLLTGTPITNRPDELIPQLEAVGKLENFGGAWRFKNRYSPQRNVALNTQELNEKLRELCFVRRNKKDVYGDLPPLRNAVQYLSIDNEQMKWYKTVESDVVEYFANRARELAMEEGSDGTAEYWQKKIALEYAKSLVKISALRSAVTTMAASVLIVCIKLAWSPTSHFAPV
jgi:SNF2 family DNA or RNA helicase